METGKERKGKEGKEKVMCRKINKKSDRDVKAVGQKDVISCDEEWIEFDGEKQRRREEEKQRMRE